MCICICSENKSVNKNLVREINNRIEDNIVIIDNLQDVLKVRGTINLFIVEDEKGIKPTLINDNKNSFLQKKIKNVVYLIDDDSSLKRLFGRNVIGCINVNCLEKDLEFICDRFTKTISTIDVENVNCNDIIYFKAEDKYVSVCTADGNSFLWRKRMNEIEKDFHRVMFRRVHRSYIVNMNYAEDIKSSYVVVGGKKIPVSRSKKENMLA